MKIDNDWLIKVFKYIVYDYWFEIGSTDGYMHLPTKDDIQKANKDALTIIEKYKKIEEIVNSKTTRLSYEDGFRQIKKVMEN